MKRSALFVSIVVLMACGTRTSLPTDTPGTADASTVSDADALDASAIDDAAADADAAAEASTSDSGSIFGAACSSSADCVDPSVDGGGNLVCCGVNLDAGKAFCAAACD